MNAVVFVTRIYVGVRKHIHVRFPEWIMAIFSALFGYILLGPRPFFDTVGFSGLKIINPSENDWGMVCIVVGLIGLFALFVNGTFQGTIYSRLSPYVRAFCAGVRAFIWLQILLAALATSWVQNTETLVSLFFSICFVFDARSLIFAFGDAGDAARERTKNGLPEADSRSSGSAR